LEVHSMDSHTLLSRRTVLKSSSVIAAAAVAGPATALDRPTVPDVLAMLLREYVDAGPSYCRAHEVWRAARQAKSKTLDQAALYFRFPDGTLGRLGEQGNAYHPQYALVVLQKMRDRALSATTAPTDMATTRRDYVNAKRRIQALTRRYRAIEAASGYEAATQAEVDAYERFNKALSALKAYRPDSLLEVSAIVAAADKVGEYPGMGNGFCLRDLMRMLERVGAA
jgi:hypothetical protein